MIIRKLITNFFCVSCSFLSLHIIQPLKSQNKPGNVGIVMALILYTGKLGARKRKSPQSFGVPKSGVPLAIVMELFYINI